MEQENNIKIIHQDLFVKKEEETMVFVFSCVDKKMIEFLLNKDRNKTISIIDKTFYKNKKIAKTYVNNHVNKTGENPMRANQAISISPFFDITSLYLQSKAGITTTSLGNKYFEMKNKTQHPSTYMSNVAILCRALGFKKIKGILINN